MSKRLAFTLISVLALAGAAAGVAAYAVVRAITDDQSRQEAVAERGARIMPFDLDKTTHVFRTSPDGGTQTVTAKNPSDGEQIALIRSHLKEEAERFSRGDFSDPAAIHDADMPGLAELSNGAARLRIEYVQIADGAMLTYTSDDEALVVAIHAWFDAQVSDHGRHASP
jgi:hypothetical protein